jgi:hypothetical protein
MLSLCVCVCVCVCVWACVYVCVGEVGNEAAVEFECLGLVRVWMVSSNAEWDESDQGGIGEALHFTHD